MAKEDGDINMNVNSTYYICSNCNGSGNVNWSVQPTCATCRMPVLRPITYHPRTDAVYLPPARRDSNTIESVSRLLSMASFSSSEREEPSSQASQNQGQEESDPCPICFIPLQHAFNERGGMSITQCCNTMLCNVCADNVQDELKKGTLKYSCIFGTSCTGNN